MAILVTGRLVQYLRAPRLARIQRQQRVAVSSIARATMIVLTRAHQILYATRVLVVRTSAAALCLHQVRRIPPRSRSSVLHLSEHSMAGRTPSTTYDTRQIQYKRMHTTAHTRPAPQPAIEATGSLSAAMRAHAGSAVSAGSASTAMQVALATMCRSACKAIQLPSVGAPASVAPWTNVRWASSAGLAVSAMRR